MTCSGAISVRRASDRFASEFWLQSGKATRPRVGLVFPPSTRDQPRLSRVLELTCDRATIPRCSTKDRQLQGLGEKRPARATVPKWGRKKPGRSAPRWERTARPAAWRGKVEHEPAHPILTNAPPRATQLLRSTTGPALRVAAVQHRGRDRNFLAYLWGHGGRCFATISFAVLIVGWLAP
jgi:hypothetical protein